MMRKPQVVIVNNRIDLIVVGSQGLTTGGW
jgi:hypothetical protein